MTEKPNKYLLHDSIKSGKLLIATQLIDENPSLNLLADEDGRYPIHWACSMNNSDLVKKLISKGNIDVDEMVDSSGWLALHIVSSIGNDEILDQLMATKPTPDVDLKTNQGTTALHLSISKKNIPVVKKLIIEYKCKVNTKDKNGYTPLMRACSNGLVSVVILLNEHRVNLNSTDNDGWTGLHHALAEGHGDAAKLLIELGAHTDIKNQQDELPIDVVVDDRVKHYVFG